LDREKYGEKRNGEKPSQVIDGTGKNMEERIEREKSGKITPNDLLPPPAVNATKPRSKPGN